MVKRIISLFMLSMIFITLGTAVNAKLPVCSDSPDGKHHMLSLGICTLEYGTSKQVGENKVLHRCMGLYECKYCGDKILVEGVHPNTEIGKYVYEHDFLYCFSGDYGGCSVNRVVINDKDFIHSTQTLEGYKFYLAR